MGSLLNELNFVLQQIEPFLPSRNIFSLLQGHCTLLFLSCCVSCFFLALLCYIFLLYQPVIPISVTGQLLKFLKSRLHSRPIKSEIPPSRTQALVIFIYLFIYFFLVIFKADSSVQRKLRITALEIGVPQGSIITCFSTCIISISLGFSALTLLQNHPDSFQKLPLPGSSPR